MAPLTEGRVSVIVFAKPPRPGEVKTRLGAVLGDDVAARLARAFIADTWALVQSIEWADPVLGTTDVDDPLWGELRGATVWPQGDGELGDRMERALGRALQTHRAAMVIGSDVPHLPVAALHQARAALAGADAVIGPSDDGGFYLIGCRGPCPHGMFAGIEWSTSHACADTEARLRSLGRTVVRVTPWFDIDEVNDLHRLRQVAEQLRRTAPETARAIESLDLS